MRAGGAERTVRPVNVVIIVLLLGIPVLMLVGTIWMALSQRDAKKNGDSQKRSMPVILGIIILSLCHAAFIALVLNIQLYYEFRWYTKACWIAAGVLAEVLLIGFMAWWWNGKRFAAWLACVLLTAAGFWGCSRYDAYLDAITLRESFDYRTYTPFTPGSLVTQADQPASLRFEDVRTVPRMDGATALYPVYAAFAQAVYPEITKPWDPGEIVRCSTTSKAYQSIVDGGCDIIFVAGPSEEQEAYAARKGVELIYTPIGREAFVFFVHPDNPISGLTVPEIQSIYAGETTRWDQLGVKGLGQILAFQRDKGSGSQTALERFVMRGIPLMTPDKETEIGMMGSIVERVSSYKNHRNAIGFSFRFYCTALMKDFDVKLLNVNGIAPTLENIENHSYPFASEFYAVTRSDAGESTQALLKWICGPQGQALVEKCGYTPVSREGADPEGR